MKKWSVIIPTMWKSLLILDLLDNLVDSDLVGEIIIIDNEKVKRLNIVGSKKIRLIEQERNIYVNPAWNLGVQLATNNNICICNDDVVFDNKLFNEISKIKLEKKVIGASRYSFEVTDNFKFKLYRGHDIGKGWGCVLFLRKSDFVDIPNELKIWCGDNWLVHTFRYCFSFQFPVKTVMSSTSNITELNIIARQDIANFENYVNKISLSRINNLKNSGLLSLNILRFSFCSWFKFD